MSQKRALGKGLDALLSNRRPAAAVNAVASASEQGLLRQLPIEWLTTGKYQPRKAMAAEALDELANSIRAQGVIQPIVVRSVAAAAGEARYEIIAGERRWRAAQLAQLDMVPCLVKEVPDEAAVVIALIENIQREDLNAIEEASALARLLEEFKLTHQEVATAVGKSRTTVSNLLRLNQLNADVKQLVERRELDMGHARALLALSGAEQSAAAQQVARRGLSVRETEKLVQKQPVPTSTLPVAADPQLDYLARQLSDTLGSSVQLVSGKKHSGKLIISYEDLAQLDRLLSYFGISES
ncbi:MAG: ParB/RepB/Spo0J family partition protein [Aeromonas sp.]